MLPRNKSVAACEPRKIYHSGNPDPMGVLSRIPVILLAKLEEHFVQLFKTEKIQRNYHLKLVLLKEREQATTINNIGFNCCQGENVNKSG